jgi:hypothetical protein
VIQLTQKINNARRKEKRTLFYLFFEFEFYANSGREHIYKKDVTFFSFCFSIYFLKRIIKVTPGQSSARDPVTHAIGIVEEI